MKLSSFIEEDFINYWKPSMFIGTTVCNWKCCIEAGIDKSVCQNHDLINSKCIEIDTEKLVKRYIDNPYTSSVIFGGLEPFDTFDDVKEFISILRSKYNNTDDIVIYTGYYIEEIEDMIKQLKQFPNIILKFGRYIPDSKPRYDNVLGIVLVSDNQYAERIS